MSVIIGTFLVLLTWALILVVWVGSGFALAGRVTGSHSRSIATRSRRAMWWGSGVFTAAVLAVGLLSPLRSAQALGAVVALLTPFVTCGLVAYVRQRNQKRRMRPPSRRFWPLIAAASISVVYLAWAALGPVTNYDSGLYHLGAIAYAGDFATIPGLANLYFPFGYNTAQFPLAAFLGNGPWQGEGFRLLNGLLIFAMVADLVLRYRSRSIGTFILAVGVVVVLVPMVALGDYWVTSPSSDPAVMVITILSVSYLADGLIKRRGASADLAVAAVLSVLTVTLRPLMAVYFVGVVLVVLVAQRTARRRLPAKGWLVVLGLTAVLGIAQTSRDYLLSGWLQFPLSIYAFDVPWRSSDPLGNRIPTLGAARDPLNLWEASEGWDWLGAWVGRLPSQWEPFLLGLIILAALCLSVPMRDRMRWRALMAVLGPVLLVDVVWFFFSPPSFRFAWGPIFALGIIPLGFALHAWFTSSRTLWRSDLTVWVIRAGGLAVLTVTVVTALFRSDAGTRSTLLTWQFGPAAISLPATPLLLPEVEEQELTGGLVIKIPVESDQCWAVYPLCTAQLSPSVQLRGTGIRDGFIPD